VPPLDVLWLPNANSGALERPSWQAVALCPASGAKIAVYAIAIAVVLGVVFYGLNNNTVNQAGTTPPSETAQQAQPANPAGPSGMRDVTPPANTEPGTTTGAAMTNRPTPPSSKPTGTEVDRSKQ
jgi:hypothetical protein